MQRKLLPKWIGPYKVLSKVGHVAYHLDLPDALRIHDVFHVSLLRPYASDGTIQPPPPILIEDEEHFEVDRILDHMDRKLRQKGNKREFPVRWLGYVPEHNSWEPEENLQDCQETLGNYWKSLEQQQSTHERVSWGNSQQRKNKSGQT